MNQTDSTLVVRQHERHTCDVPARFSVDTAHHDRVTIAFQSTGMSTGDVPVRIIDCSAGGLGLRSPVYIPKTGRIRVQFELADGGPPIDTILRVMRASMQDRTPSYYLGGAFTDDSPSTTAALARLVAAIRQKTAGPTGEAARA
ncbi:MAG: PilZ domain-containing protein [Phycisphaerales bacterium]